MVAPNDNISDVFVIFLELHFFLQLADTPILIESGQSSEVLQFQIGGVNGTDHGVGIGGISNDHDLAISIGIEIEHFSLGFEDHGILAEQVLPFHAGASGLGADQHCDLAVHEAFLLIGLAGDFIEKRKSAVFQFHDHSFQLLFLGGHFQKGQVYSLFWAQHSALSDHE